MAEVRARHEREQRVERDDDRKQPERSVDAEADREVGVEQRHRHLQDGEVRCQVTDRGDPDPQQLRAECEQRDHDREDEPVNREQPHRPSDPESRLAPELAAVAEGRKEQHEAADDEEDVDGVAEHGPDRDRDPCPVRRRKHPRRSEQVDRHHAEDRVGTKPVERLYA